MNALDAAPGDGALLDLVGAVYEGPLEPEPWAGFAERLRSVLAARNVAITLHHGEGPIFDTYVMAAEAGDDTDWDEVEAVYRERFMLRDPRRPGLVAPGEILNIDVESLGPEIRAYLATHNIGDSLRTSFAEPGGMRCWIDIVRALHPRAPFAEPELALLRLLLPHLARALRLYARQKRQEAEKAVYEDTIDHFLVGSVLLDGELRVVRANRAAETIVAAHGGIAIARERLHLADAAKRRALEAALARALQAARAPPDPQRRGELVRLDLPDGTLLGLLVYPVAQTRYYQGPYAPNVVVYLTDLTRKLDALAPAREASQALLAQLFGLTPQEARLALLLADGSTLAAAAHSLGVAETAARSYSKRIYAKMGIRSQSDIVRMVYRSFALLR